MLLTPGAWVSETLTTRSEVMRFLIPCAVIILTATPCLPDGGPAAQDPAQDPAPAEPKAPALQEAKATTFRVRRPRAGQKRREDIHVALSLDWGRPVSHTWGGRREVTILEVDAHGIVQRARIRFGDFVDHSDLDREDGRATLADRSFLAERVSTSREECGRPCCYGGWEVVATEERADGGDLEGLAWRVVLGGGVALRGPAPVGELAMDLFQDHEVGFPASIVGTRHHGWEGRWEDDTLSAALAPGARLPLPPAALEPLRRNLLGRDFVAHTATLTYRGLRQVDGQPLGVFDLEVAFATPVVATGARFAGEMRGEVLIDPASARPTLIAVRGTATSSSFPSPRPLLAWEARQSFQYLEPD
ncbi:MAG: hypothetical protein M9894_22835 [Planctomycetes bacterium]|nr:hypothetical protein [Planctomycetota bacterium]